MAEQLEQLKPGLSNGYKWLFSFLIAVLGAMLLYNPENMQVTTFWFVTLFAISLFAFEPIPVSLTALFMCFSYIILGVAGPNVVFTPWTTFIPWQVSAGLIITIIVDKSGFAKRLTLLIISTVGRTPALLFLSYIIDGYVLNTIVPSGTTTTFIIASFSVGLCKALGLAPDSRASSCIMLTSLFVGEEISSNFYINNLGIVGFSMLPAGVAENDALSYFADNFFLIFPSIVISLSMIYFYCRNELKDCIEDARRTIQQDYKAMGKISSIEVRAISLLILAVASFTFQDMLGVPGAFTLAILIYCSFLPFMKILTVEDFNKIPWGIIFFITGCMGIGMVAGSLGIPSWFSGLLAPLFETFNHQASANVFFYLIGIMGNLVLTPLASVTTFTLPAAELAAQLGFSVKPMMYSLFIGASQWLFPYEMVHALFIYATGYVRMKHLFVILILRMITVGMLVWLNSVTYWDWFNV